MLIMKELLSNIVKGIETGIFYPTYNTEICKWCNHTSRCKKYSLTSERNNREKSELEKDGYRLLEV